MATGTINSSDYEDASSNVTVNISLGNDAVSLYRQGKVVSLSLRTYSSSSGRSISASNDKVFTIPEGFRPPNNISLMGIYSKQQISGISQYLAATFEVRSDGEVHVPATITYYQVWVLGSYVIK